MNRRQFVASAVLSLGLAGCTGSGPGGETEIATPESCWPQMCAGTTLLAVEVVDSFSDDVVLEADCRDAELHVDPGQRVSIERTEAGESCSVRLAVDGDIAYDDGIPGYQRTTLTVTASGEIETETLVL